MNRILITTALVSVLAAPALSEDRDSAGPVKLRASDLMAMNIYIPEAGADDAMAEMDLTDVPDDWENVGDISDVIISSTGKVTGVIVDAGGFLGIGEKEVHVTMDNLRFAPDRDDPGGVFIVYTGERSKLEQKGSWDWDLSGEDGGMQDRAQAEDTGDTEPDYDFTEPTEPADGMLSAEEIAALDTDLLDGVPAYDANNDHIGEIDAIVPGDEGGISNVVIDVGGFLGIGEKPVALPLEEVWITRTDDGGLQVWTKMTRTDLEAMGEWRE